ncbi:hypothetical protein [Mucilaginibacter aquatilis]|uniref:Uncharacterized protein n=1 Tax=Mucilaginibacter aquatilis TaxID=1517760 RepID=A0A6I4I6M5_9SPHI|nr:hypothetical protein [Mucilaginibacter aquatilis]MVN90527.1 hypothetical protein [Mucilaginibacter aquatilis]
MEFAYDVRFLDTHYDALVHFMSTFIVSNYDDAKKFVEEFNAALVRRGATLYISPYYRIDTDEELKKKTYAMLDFMKGRTNATITVEQFFMQTPDQDRSLSENMTDKFLAGEESSALIGDKFRVPVRVLDNETREPITADQYFFSIEHLIPRNK